MLLARMKTGAPQAVSVLAHTLNGSARGVGAWRVSEAAEALERATIGAAPSVPGDAIARLDVAVAEAHAAITELLHAA
jgi:HPt (histidine-containing phosphotransfer) domain-containing protein